MRILVTYPLRAHAACGDHVLHGTGTGWDNGVKGTCLTEDTALRRAVFMPCMWREVYIRLESPLVLNFFFGLKSTGTSFIVRTLESIVAGKGLQRSDFQPKFDSQRIYSKRVGPRQHPLPGAFTLLHCHKPLSRRK